MSTVQRAEPREESDAHAGGGFRSAQRLFGGEAGAMREASETLELSAPVVEVPRVVSAEPIEGTTLRAWRVEGEAAPGFAAFLDGIQRSRVVHYVAGAPIVHGTVAAVVRRRVARRLSTWKRPVVASRLYIPKSLALEAWAIAEHAGWAVRNTEDGGDPALRDAHPFELLTRAVHAVQNDRELAEQHLAEEWCGMEHEPLLIDGGLGRSQVVARASCVVGVVKSHRSLYAESDAMRTVLALRAGFRSTVFRVASARRHPVASWYLRLHDPAGRDPMWGLVRVEVAEPPSLARREALTERADEVSRWVLAERAPLALPDGRWDKMVYGIRDCEEVLRAAVM